MYSPLPIFKTATLLMWSLLIMLLPICISTIWTNTTTLIEWTMIPMTSTPITLHLIMDPIGLMFSCTVLFISANVLSFSKIYMANDTFANRFTILVILFVLSMNFLIYLPHLMILLLGWDGLGLTSFILVIYYQNAKSLGAGMITALSNRVGDALLLVAIGLTLNQGHWLIINMSSSNPSALIQVILIMVAAMTKSAQMPFSSWLPAAMAAPTPVSALVHSSTLVTAGVFLLIRFYPFLHSISQFNLIILVISTMTMFMAGISATTECDMKKIIALSTLSQLGLMMMSIGLNMPKLAFFHMVTHAMFKALLFICAGSLINYHHHTQDLRWMGNITNQMPITNSCITIANLALCGFPFMAGFYSKDMIMEWAMFSNTNMVILMLSFISVGTTMFYSIRFSVATMWSSSLSTSMMNLDEETLIIKPMMFLSIMAIMSGAALSWTSVITSMTMVLPTHLKILPMLMILLGASASWVLTNSRTNSKLMLMPMSHYASCMMWFLVPLSTQFMLKAPYTIAHNFLKSIDQGWIEAPQMMNDTLIKYNNLIIHSSPPSPDAIVITSATALMLITALMTTMSLY